MKYLMILIMSLMVTSCGEDNVYYVEKDGEVMNSFQGYFTLDGPSTANCIFLNQKAQFVVDIETDCQSLVSTNPQNSTLGQFPTISATNLVVIDGKINYTRNLNYTSGHDLEEDVNGSNITGSRRTDIQIKFVGDKLHIKLDIYDNANNANLNEIVATRIFNEL